MADAVITVKDLNYYYPGTKALEDVTFTINKGDITALVGPNGSGKTVPLHHGGREPAPQYVSCLAGHGSKSSLTRGLQLSSSGSCPSCAGT